MTWNVPSKEVCPICSKNLFVKGGKSGKLVCESEGCGYERELKNDLIYILMQEDGNKKAEMLQQIYDEISRNIVPIRPERHYHRTKGVLAGKYSNTHKRCF